MDSYFEIQSEIINKCRQVDGLFLRNLSKTNQKMPSNRWILFVKSTQNASKDNLKILESPDSSTFFGGTIPSARFFHLGARKKLKNPDVSVFFVLFLFVQGVHFLIVRIAPPKKVEKNSKKSIALLFFFLIKIFNRSLKEKV